MLLRPLVAILPLIAAGLSTATPISCPDVRLHPRPPFSFLYYPLPSSLPLASPPFPADSVVRDTGPSSNATSSSRASCRPRPVAATDGA
ncbi:hypothetical protein BT67DRAFT_439556 [Trichocladium antarcticum]|uniref:Secreted protein n=1 Tax=Trichocladium antarcticum TaxID=1450529 RepID=A0AAN6ZEV6_9PEZI|nr:hypothetical protein BT67DRAFT_439556 [Trichocladium antarcticum]